MALQEVDAGQISRDGSASCLDTRCFCWCGVLLCDHCFMFEVCGSCLRQAGIVVIVKHLWRVAVEAMLDNRECKAALQGRLKMAARPFDFKQIRCLLRRLTSCLV